MSSINTSIWGTTPDTLGYVYAVLLLAGGLLGFLRRGSLVSLIAGGLTAAGQAYGSHALGINRINIFPVMLVNSVLFLVMAYRFFKSNKFMPAGILMVGHIESDPEHEELKLMLQCLTCANLARYGANMVE